MGFEVEEGSFFGQLSMAVVAAAAVVVVVAAAAAVVVAAVVVVAAAVVVGVEVGVEVGVGLGVGVGVGVLAAGVVAVWVQSRGRSTTPSDPSWSRLRTLCYLGLRV